MKQVGENEMDYSDQKSIFEYCAVTRTLRVVLQLNIGFRIKMTMTMRILSLVLVLALAGLGVARTTERNIKFVNECGSKVEIYWVHPQTRDTTLMSSPNVMNGATFSLDSYVGHEFELREMPSAKTGVCKGEGETCRTNYVTVSENDDQVVTIDKSFTIEFLDDQVRARLEAEDLVTKCQEDAKQRLKDSSGSTEDSMKALDDLVNCVQGGVADTLAKVNEEISFQATIRRGMAAQMENYTCADPTLESSKAVEESVWRGASDQKRRKVHVMLNRPASKIHVIENFIDAEECEAMEEAAKPKLHKATVADGKGGSQFSDNRKAMQAGIRVPWSKESSGDLIARVSRKVYDYTNHVLGLGIQEFGQEDLMSIQYFGRGENDTEPDRYTPHCDGECNGLPHKPGTRMATMVLYCTVPEVGGHTNFRNAGVHVKPTVGNGIFFSYIDPETLISDNGFTEHSGCPVFLGEKKIVTQWIRLGVDDDHPWDSFNTLGISKKEED